MEFHKVAELFPLIEGADYEEFKQDIKERGLKEPIVTWKGKIIDGRNRFRACRELGVKPVYVEWDGEGLLEEHVKSLNLHRRHLESGQKAMIGAKISLLLEEAAKARMLAGKALDPTAILQEGGEVTEIAGKQLGVSARAVAYGRAVYKTGVPTLQRAVERGQVEVHHAAEIAKLPQDQQASIVGKGPEAMVAKAQELRGEKKEHATSPLRESKPIATKGATAVRKYLDARIDVWAKSKEPHASAMFDELHQIRKDLCGVEMTEN